MKLIPSKQKYAPPIMVFPNRVWEPGVNGGWVSRQETDADRKGRRQLARSLSCIAQFQDGGRDL